MFEAAEQIDVAAYKRTARLNDDTRLTFRPDMASRILRVNPIFFPTLIRSVTELMYIFLPK